MTTRVQLPYHLTAIVYTHADIAAQSDDGQQLALDEEPQP